MNILMMTNTYVPHVGGVARSVAAFTNELRTLGHRVVVVAPEYKEDTEAVIDVIRIPAIQHFNGSDFSVILPIPVFLETRLQDFRPDIVHSHHPFLIGSTAARVAAKYAVPLVYTQHTMYEQYTHYVPVGSYKMKKFVISLSTGYANISDQVLAPSDSAAQILRQRGVMAPIQIVPTGVYFDRFEHGQGHAVRTLCGIEKEAFVVGHVGRLAPEKNLDFLSEAVALFLQDDPRAHFIVVGYGPSMPAMSRFFHQNNLLQRVHFLGKLQNQELVDAYHAMNAFVFSSKSETQGLVLVEAMAAGVPVIGLDAPGVREVINDEINGYLLEGEQPESFAHAISKMSHLPDEARHRLIAETKKTAESFSMANCTAKLVTIYETLRNRRSKHTKDDSLWQKSAEQLKTEWDLLANLTSAVENAIIEKDKA